MQAYLRRISHFSIIATTLVATASALHAQHDPWHCGTLPSMEDTTWLRQFQQRLHRGEHLPDQWRGGNTIWLPVKAHIVGDNDGTGYLPIRRLVEAFCRTNYYFRNTGIQFYISGTPNYINNTAWNNHEDFWLGLNMIVTNNFPNVINAYFSARAATAAGYNFSDVGLVVANQYMNGTAAVLAHELGHHLSLPHTFLGWEGITVSTLQPAPTDAGGRPVEYFDGRNCTFAGDGFCDTPADYISQRWACDANYLSYTLRDPDNVQFRVDGGLVMSYSLDNCKDHNNNGFSGQQTAAMRAYSLSQYASYINPAITGFDSIVAPVTAITPTESDLATNDGQITFSWRAVPAATRYVFQLCLTPNCTFVDTEIITSDTTVVLNRTLVPRPAGAPLFAWRVLPYSNGYFCAGFSPVVRFNVAPPNPTYVPSAAPTLLDVRPIGPNPITTGRPFQLELTTRQAQTLRYTLFTATGAEMLQGQLSLASGTNVLALPTDHLAPGAYFVSLRTATDVHTLTILVGR